MRILPTYVLDIRRTIKQTRVTEYFMWFVSSWDLSIHSTEGGGFQNKYFCQLKDYYFPINNHYESNTESTSPTMNTNKRAQTRNNEPDSARTMEHANPLHVHTEHEVRIKSS